MSRENGVESDEGKGQGNALLIKERTKVVKAKAERPRGAGLANF